jgi:hypothetical protein
MGDVWGHRKDLDEYYTIPYEAINTIKSLTRAGASAEEIVEKVQKKAKLGSDLIRYLARTEVPA